MLFPKLPDLRLIYGGEGEFFLTGEPFLEFTRTLTFVPASFD